MVTFASDGKPKALEIDPEKWVLQRNTDNDRYAFDAPEKATIPPEELETIGLAAPGRGDEGAIRELVEFYQRPDLDGGSLALLWDFEGQAHYFGRPQGQQASMSAFVRKVPGRLPDGAKREGMAVMIGERAGQMVGEVRISGTRIHEGKTFRGRTLSLLSKTDDGHWRFINFDGNY